MPTAARDTEITLGVGKLLAVFFGLVVLCSLCFTLGFLAGRNGFFSPGVAGATPGTATAANVTKGKTPKPAGGSVSATPARQAEKSPAAAPVPTSAAPASTGAGPGYFVQVAAVSRQEDADALIGSLKSRQYAAFAAATPGDKLIHVQVGPFSDVKEAEAMRVRLSADGYSPILKR